LHPNSSNCNELKAKVAAFHEKNQQLTLENNFATVKQEKRDILEKGADEMVNKIQLYANMENDSLTRGKIDLYYADLHKVTGNYYVGPQTD